MNHEQHPLDRRFGQALRRHEQTPRPEAWKRLEARLGREEARRLVPFWAYGVAASVALLLLAGVWWLRQPEPAGEDQSQVAVAAPKEPVGKTPAVRTPVIPREGRSEKKMEPVLPAEAPRMAQRTSAKPAAKPLIFEKKPVTPQPEAAPVVKTEALLQVATVEPAQPSGLPKEPQTTVTPPSPAAPAVESAKTVPTTLVVTLANTDFDDKETSQPRKRSRFGRILRQLKNAKEGERVDWNEVGFNPNALLARAEAKLERGTEKVNQTYQTVKEKTQL
jgi:hypothetical protein